MSEPTNADIQESIKVLAAEIRTRIEGLASDGARRDTAQTESRAKLEAKLDASVAALNQGLANLNQEMVTVKAAIPDLERKADAAASKADKAMGSHHDLQTESHAYWSSVMARLDKQDKDRDLILQQQKLDEEMKRASEAAARKQESLAAQRMQSQREAAAKAEAAAKEAEAKRLADERQAKNDRLKILVPAAQAICIAVIGGFVSYMAVRIGHQDTDAKLERQNQQLSSLTQKIQAPSLSAAAGAPEPPTQPAAAAPAAAAPVRSGK